MADQLAEQKRIELAYHLLRVAGWTSLEEPPDIRQMDFATKCLEVRDGDFQLALDDVRMSSGQPK